jgi:hypothetical protein
MRNALIVGIDHYEHLPRLYGCVNDSHEVKGVLERHYDGTKNFDTVLLAGGEPGDGITRETLKDAVEQLFTAEGEVALLYFAGHGHIEATGGYLCSAESRRGDEGLSYAELMTLAHSSPALSKVIILDSCHSGAAGVRRESQIAELTPGMTILTASTEQQYASEENGRGVFSSLFVDALHGAAGNLVGDVTPGSVYAHIDQSLGWWAHQRPVFRTNVQNFVRLRKVKPPIELADLRRIVELFPVEGEPFKLDPTFEPERPACGCGTEGIPPPDEANTAIFAILQKYNRIGLLVPVDAPHMWHAAMHSKACKLTVLGEHYRRLVAEDRI